MRYLILLLISLVLFSHVLDASRTQVLTQTVARHEELSTEMSETLPFVAAPLLRKAKYHRQQQVNVGREAAGKRRLPATVDAALYRPSATDVQQIESSSLISSVFSWTFYAIYFFVSYIASSLIQIPLALGKVAITVPSFAFLCFYNPVAAIAMVLHGIYSLAVGIYLSPLYVGSVILASAAALVDFSLPFTLTYYVQFGIVEPIKSFLYMSLYGPWIILYPLSTAVHFYADAPANSTDVSENHFAAGPVLNRMLSGVEALGNYVFPQELYNALMQYTLFEKAMSAKVVVAEFIKEMPPGMWSALWYVAAFLIRTLVPYGDKIVYLLENGGAAYEYVVEKAGEAKEFAVETATNATVYVGQKAVEAKELAVEKTYDTFKIPTTEETYKEEIKEFLAKQTLPVLLENIELPMNSEKPPTVKEGVPSVPSVLSASKPTLNRPEEPKKVFYPYRPLIDHARMFQGGTMNTQPPPLRAR